MDSRLDDWNWCEAFKYAQPSACLGDTAEVHLGTFERDGVAEILGIAEGDNDGPDWLVCGRLHDGRWFVLSAGCDYTGWG